MTTSGPLTADTPIGEWVAHPDGGPLIRTLLAETGAASGIGRATASRIAREGGRVVAADVSAGRLRRDRNVASEVAVRGSAAGSPTPPRSTPSSGSPTAAPSCTCRSPTAAGRCSDRAAVRGGARAARAPSLPDVTVELHPGLRVYRPHTPRPDLALRWIHGGGLVIGGAGQDDRFCAATAAGSQSPWCRPDTRSRRRTRPRRRSTTALGRLR